MITSTPDPTGSGASDQTDWDAAVDWLLNSRHIPLDVHNHFFHLSNGQECDCDLD